MYFHGIETFEKCSFLFKFKKGENFNHPRGICFAFHGAGRNTLSISRIKLKLHFVHNVEADAEIEQKGAFCKGLESLTRVVIIVAVPGCIWEMDELAKG